MLRKILGTLLGIVAFYMCIMYFTYAFYVWRSTNTAVNLVIEDFEFKFENDASVSFEKLGPVLDYLDKPTIQNRGVAYTDFTAYSNLPGYMAVNFNITSIATSLLTESFKYSLVEYTDSTYNTVKSVVDEGNFKHFEVQGNNSIATNVEVEGTQYYRFIVYIDGKMYNSNDMMGKTMNGVVNLRGQQTPYTAMLKAYTSNNTFWAYRDKITKVIFDDEINIPSNIASNNKWDVSSNNSNLVQAYIKSNGTNANGTTYDLHIQGDSRIYANTNSSNLFSEFLYLSTIEKAYLLNTSKVTNMSSMFSNAGKQSTLFDIGNIGVWDISKVINMDQMFYNTGSGGSETNLITFNIGDLSNWNTSSVTSALGTFYGTGINARVFDIGNIGNWNTQNITTMKWMFVSAGKNSQIFNIGQLNYWNVSKVQNMNCMFNYTGYKATTFDIGNLNNWNTISLKDALGMFSRAGYSATDFNIGKLDNWNVSNVTNMREMFYNAGYSATIWNIGNLDKWNTGNVTNMNAMFFGAGANATKWNIGDISGWNISKVTDKTNMFDSNRSYMNL